ncbi:MAG: hypothetical protein ACREBG_07180 [Pyrinomonadaceae bacterium]
MYGKPVISIVVLTVMLLGAVYGDDAEVRRELEQIAKLQIQAFKARDVKAYLKYLAPDYSTKTLEGNILSLTRAELEREILSDMEDTISIDFVIRDIEKLEVTGKKVVIVVNQKSSRVVKAENVRHKWEADVVQKETWIRTNEGLKLSLIEMLKIKYSKEDGKAIADQNDE